MVAAPAGPSAVVATQAEPRESALVGMHGSLTSADQLVPLLVAVRDVGSAPLSAANYEQLPADLPVPEDDGAAAHLPGTAMPSVSLPATGGARLTWPSSVTRARSCTSTR